MKIFNNLAIKVDNLLDKSHSLKQLELCRPISVLKKLIETQTIRKESPDSTLSDLESKETFNDSKIVSTDNTLNTNNKKLFKRESLKKIEEFLFLPTPQKKSRESSLFNFHAAKKESLVPINENIEVIAEEENNDFLLTGIKFNLQKKQLVNNSNYYFETENENSYKNKKTKDKDNNLPPLLKNTSSISAHSIRNNLLFGKNDTNKDSNSLDGI